MTAVTQQQSTEKSPGVRQHVGYLDGIRALAALDVIVQHCFLQLPPHFPMPGWLSAAMHVVVHGHYAVDVFIVLSGFCLAIPPVRGSGQVSGGAWTFFGKRARRILPTYFFALALSLLLIWLAIGQKTGTHWDISVPVTAAGLVTHMLLVQDMFANSVSQINHALWSISVEWRIYFLFPLLLMLRRRWNSAAMAAAALVVGYTLVTIGEDVAPFNTWRGFDVFGSAPHYMGLFALGILGADIAFGQNPPLAQLRRPAPAFAALAVTTAAFLFVSVAKVWHGATLPTPWKDLVVGIWAMCLMLAAACPEAGGLGRALSWRPLVAIGTFAYSVYLIHAPLIQLIWQYLLFPLAGNPLYRFYALCVIGIPLIIGCAYLFFLAFERPFLNTRKREKFVETERDAVLNPGP